LVKIISDIEWNEFVNDNIVTDDVIEVIAIRTILNKDLTEREIAIYKEHSQKIENKIKKLDIEF
jgi:hypothetical protein